MLTIKKSWMPGFNEPESWPEAIEYLEAREANAGSDMYLDKQGGQSLAYTFAIGADSDIELRGPWCHGMNYTSDLRDLLVAEAIKANCNSCVWWMVEQSGEDEDGEWKWCFYAGQWDDRVGVACLIDSSLELPLVWTAPNIEPMRKRYDLMEA